MEEESYSSHTISLGVLKRFIFFRVPFLALIAYSLALVNYPSIGYLCFGLILLNLEIEKRFKKNKDLKKLEGNKHAKVRDMLDFKNYKQIVYYLLLIFSLIVFLGKLVILLSYYFWPYLYQRASSYTEHNNFELYFIDEFTIENFLITFLPNLAIILMAGVIIISQGYLSKARIDTLGKFRAIGLSYYILVGLIVITTFCLSIANVSFGSMLFITVIVVFLLLWSNLKIRHTRRFYPFARVLQVFSIIAIILQYLASINTFRAALAKIQVMNLTFLGMTNYNEFTSTFPMICSVLCLFGVLLFSTYFADVKKLEEVREIVQKITTPNLLEDFNKAFSIEIDLEKEGEHQEEHKEQEEEHKEEHKEEEKEEHKEEEPEEEKENHEEHLVPKKQNVFLRRAKTLVTQTWYSQSTKNFQAKMIPVIQSLKKIGFLVRVLQVGTILVISRYYTVFSLPMMIWLFVTSLTYRLNIIYFVTLFLGLPSSVLQFYALYYGQIPDNMITPNIPTWCGNLTIDSHWLECLLAFALFILHCNFLRLLKINLTQGKNRMSTSPETPSASSGALTNGWVNLLVTLFLKNTYYLSLIGLYVIGTYEVSIFNLVLVVFFIVFFVSENYAKRYWSSLLIIVIIILSTRYIWVMGWFSVDSNEPGLSIPLSLVGIVDIDIETTNLTGTVADQDSTTNIVFWTMFLFVLLQYDVYRNTRGYQKTTLEILRESKFLNKKFPSLRHSIETMRSIYYQGFFWFGYMVITLILCIEDFSLLGLAQAALLTFIFSLHIFRIKANPETAHHRMFRLWNLFILSSTLIIAVIYFYSFTRFNFLEDYILDLAEDSDVLNFIIVNALFIGFSDATSLRTVLLGQIFILVFAVSMRDICKLYRRLYHEKISQQQEQQAEEERNPNEAPLLNSFSNLQQHEDSEKYLQASFLRQWPRLARALEIISYFFTAIAFLYVLILSTRFRLSVMFLIMLAIYCYYFYKLNSAAIGLFNKRHLPIKINLVLDELREWFINNNSMENRFINKFASAEQIPLLAEFLDLTLKWRLKVWKLVFLCSISSFLLTYMFRMLSFPLFQTGNAFLAQNVINSNNATFIFGVYAQNSGFLSVNYPYILLIIISVVELNLAQLLEKLIMIKLKPVEKKQEEDIQAQRRTSDNNTNNNVNMPSHRPSSVIVSAEAMKNLLPEKLIIPEDAQIEELQEDEETSKVQFTLEQTEILDEIQYIKEDNILIEEPESHDSPFIPNRPTFSKKDAVKNYYQENFSYLQLQVLEGCYALATQAMVWIMLFNAVNKQNIFGAYYLIGACLVWKYMDKEMKIITKITNFTIIVLLIQYALLVFNINPATSPMTLPSINNTPSILAYIYGSTMISQNQFIKVLGLGNSYSVTLSLIGDGVTFLVVQLCMWINVLRAEYILNSLPNNLVHESQVEKFEESPQHKRGYKSLRPFNYGLLKTAAKLIILHSSRITILILTFISLFNVSIPNFILAALFLANIILIDFRLSELTFEKRTKLMIIMFKVTQVCLIIFLAIYIVMNLPFNAFPLFEFNTTTIDKIFIFCILQLHLNLIRTDYYVSVYKKHNEKSSVKARLSAMCITYKFNDTKLYKYLQNYIRKKNLNVKLEEISERIENWNNQFANDARSYPPKLTYGEANTVVKDEEKGENQFDNYGPTQEIIVETEEHEEEDNKDHEHDEHEDHEEDAKKEEETKKRSFLTRIKVALVRKLIQWRNPFLFAYTSDLYKYVVENNKNITSDKMKDFSLNWTTSELQKASTTLDYIDSFYANLELTIQQNPESDIDKSIERLTQSGFEHHYVPRSRGNTNVTVIQFGEDDSMPELPAMRRLGSIWKSSMIMDDQDEVTKDDEYEDYSIFQTVSLVIQVCLSYWEYFCYFAFVLYQITSQGYLMILIPIAIFGYALTEETRCTFRFWTISFVFIATVTLIKFVFECFFYTGSLSSTSFGQFLQQLVGPTTGFYWEFALIVMLLIQVALIKQYGFEQASEATVENVNKAFLRRKIHNDFADLKPKQKTIVKHESIKSATSASPLLKPPSNQDEIPDLEKTLSEVELDFKNNLIRFPQTSKANYFFRLFSPSNKKIGRDIYPLIALLQLIVAIFIILFYSSIEDGELSESLVDSLKFNEFSGPMVIILFLQIGIVLLDRRIILINNKKQKIMKEEKLTFSERVSSRKSIYSRLNAEEKRVERPKRNSTIIAAKPKRTKDKKKTTKVTDKVMANIANSHALTEEAFLTHAIFFKFVLQAVLLLAMAIFIYFYVPNVQEAPWPLNDPATIIFYILYIIYFTLSALQLKYGIPEFSGRMVLMNDYTFYNSIAYQSYRAIPFFFEIKTFMDWTFTVTALDLFQWLKFEDVYGQLFVAKINTDMRLEDRSLGEKIDKISKFFFGCCGIFLLLVLILGPLLLFSTYNPFGTDDYVVGATVSVGLQIQNYYFPIFENSHVATIQPVTSAQYSAMANQPGVRDVGYNSLQYITMSPFSEQTWSIAEPNFALLQTSLNDISQLLSTQTVDTLNSSTNTSANLQVNVEFLQYQSQSTNSAPVTTTLTYNFYDSNVSSHVNATISLLYNMTNCSGDQLHVPGAYDSLFRLTANQAPIPAASTNTFSQGVYLQLICPPNITGGPDNSLQIANSYWQITTDGKSTGFVFFTITNKVSSFLISFSIEAFYIGIVLLVGNVVRTVVMGQIQNLTLSDLPDARELIQVCEGILIARAEKNLVKEEILYWELIDILRSPEVLKLITKSAVQERLLKAEKIKKD